MNSVIRSLAEAIFPALDATECGPPATAVARYKALSGADQPEVVTHVSRESFACAILTLAHVRTLVTHC
jgi:hypothetical protein